MRHKKIVWLVPGMLGLAMLACNFQAVVEEGQGERSRVVVETVSAYATKNPPAEDGDLEALEGIAPPPTWTPRPPTPTKSPTPSPTEEVCSDRVGFVADMTYPDDSEVDAGVAFTKTWRLRNDGTCEWTPAYDLVFDSGDSLGAAASIALTGNVAPGATVDLSAQMAAPNDPGTYQGFWMLRSGEGQPFGLGSNGDVAFWVKIVVPSPLMVLQPIMPAPILPIQLYTSSGSIESLGQNECFDLDAGGVVGCGSSSADFLYRLGAGDTPRLESKNGASILNYQAGQPSKQDCSSLILLGHVALGHELHVCYETTNGNYGWLLPDLHLYPVNPFGFAWVTFQ